MRKVLLTAFFFGSAITVGTVSLAEVWAGEIVPSEEIVQALARKAQSVTDPDDPMNIPLRLKGVSVEPMPARAIDFPIPFGFDSAALAENAYDQVREIGLALQELGFRKTKVLVIGHTDTRGDEVYNRVLSERRAETVVSTLIEDFGISPEVLVPIGKGESEPVVPDEENDNDYARNRRVELRVAE